MDHTSIKGPSDGMEARKNSLLALGRARESEGSKHRLGTTEARPTGPGSHSPGQGTRRAGRT